MAKFTGTFVNSEGQQEYEFNEGSEATIECQIRSYPYPTQDEVDIIIGGESVKTSSNTDWIYDSQLLEPVDDNLYVTVIISNVTGKLRKCLFITHDIVFLTERLNVCNMYMYFMSLSSSS